ncbi:MAG: S46 family peptidase [Planctomycetota bacterium]|nr:S46 family peptidase [Planctomycetota bacterium]
MSKNSIALFFLSLLIAPCSLHADEGMWLFNGLPIEQFKTKYGFEPTPEWTDHLMKSSVRFNVGGSASFVSSNGLVLTNHHVGSDTLNKLSTQENNYYEDGFLAETFEEELKAPDLELNQLVKITDVTDQVDAAVKQNMSPGEAAAARRAAISRIEQSATEKSGLRSDVVTLYGGARYHLYQYKKYTDVRLVWAPESAIAFFGGDADNFEYPRYCLDACLFRVYEDGKPAEIEHFLKWSPDGAEEDELVFVSGNPGSTSRIYTVAALKFERDHYLPYILDFIRRREILLQQFGLNSAESARIAKDGLFGFQNARKARMGMLQGLQDPALMKVKEEEEKQILAKVKADPKLKQYAAAWDKIAELQQQKAKRLGSGISLNTRLFNIGQTLVQMSAEDKKPSDQRLAEFRDSARASLEQQLFSSAPIYPELEQAILADLIARMLELRGADDPLCQKILQGQNPSDRAAELVSGTRLMDVDFRKKLAQEGTDGNQDPMIQLAQLVDPIVRQQREENEALQELERQAYSQISEALFATQGTSTYPDATFTLRLSYGPVKGYQENGKTVPPFTRMGGTFDHEQAHAGQPGYQLPESWRDADSKLNPETPFNFVCTADIIGGNSGSPVVNKDLELVGLIFDGNIQSLIGDYIYSDKQGRSVSVHSSAIREALRKIYGADSIADQLGK